jgi:predicted O-methyltransferase YrrM
MQFCRMIKTIIHILITLFKNPKKLLRVLDEPENTHEVYVKDKYNLPSGLQIVEMEEITGKSQFELPLYLALEGGSTPFDLMLLRTLAELEHVKTYFEIGTWRGESALAVYDKVEKVYTLNLSETEMRKRNWPESYIEQSGMLIGQSSNIIQLEGDSLRYDFSAYTKSCDLIFVDGDHHYRHVVNDTKKAFELLRNENSMIVWHDYGYSPEVIRWEVLNAILEGTPELYRKNLYHVANTKCAVFSLKPFYAVVKERPMKPDKFFSIEAKVSALK